MSITDELREWVRDGKGSLLAIADRIDAEHEAMLVDARKTVYQGYIELPKDADGEYIHIGDAVTCGATVWTVTGLKLLGEGWGICCTVYNEYGGSGTSVYPPSDLRHHHAPTVEDVLREFADGLGVPVADSYVAAAASKLRLAGDAE